jgi:hypothetical protein
VRFRDEVIVLIDDGFGGAVPAPVRIRDRLIARLRAGRIDRSLAAGASPDASVINALRARSLTAMRYRRGLSRALHRAVMTAMVRPTLRSPAVVLDWSGIIRASADIEELSWRLVEGGPVAPRGVALTKLLLIDGAGPLHDRRSPERLANSVRAAINSLCLIPSA